MSVTRAFAMDIGHRGHVKDEGSARKGGRVDPNDCCVRYLLFVYGSLALFSLDLPLCYRMSRRLVPTFARVKALNEYGVLPRPWISTLPV